MMFNLDDEKQPIEIRVPGLSNAVPMGDAVQRMIQALGVHALGVKPCTPCHQRQQYLNQHVRFTPWHQPQDQD